MKEYVTQDGKKIYRLSRWIKIKHDFITSRHCLFNYCDKYDDLNSIDYFEWNKRKYAIGQFMRLENPIFFENEEGKTSYLSGYDSENWYDPILIELDDCCESVRVFTEKDI